MHSPPPWVTDTDDKTIFREEDRKTYFVIIDESFEKGVIASDTTFALEEMV